MSDLETLKAELLKDIESFKGKTNMYKEKKGKSMGLGPLGAPDITFVRKFRWTLSGTNLKEHFVKKVDFDWVSHVITLEVMEAISKGDTDLNVHHWLELWHKNGWKNEELYFTTYDGCGNPLYEYRLTGLKLVGDLSGFDYSLSDVSSRYITVEFQKYERKYLVVPEIKACPKPLKKAYQFCVSVEDKSREYPVKTTVRPHINIEETEINFLNCKSWIPGKTDWQDIYLTIDKMHGKDFVSELMNSEFPTLHLSVCSQNCAEKLETWTLKGCELLKMDWSKGHYVIAVRYQTATYKSHVAKGCERNDYGKESDDQLQGTVCCRAAH